MSETTLRMPLGQLSSAPHLGLHTLNVVHDAIGWALIVLAVIIVLTSKRAFGDRAFAIVLAVLIVVVVLAGCGTPALADTGVAGPSGGTLAFSAALLLIAAGGMGLAALFMWLVSIIFVYVLRVAIPAAVVVGLYFLFAIVHALHV